MHQRRFRVLWVIVWLVAAAAVRAQAGDSAGIEIADDTPHPELNLTKSDALPSAWGDCWRGVIHSSILKEDRIVHIAVPSSFSKTNRKYPAIVLTDGAYYFEAAAIAARELSQSGHIPESIVVGVETPRRRTDLTPPGMSRALSDGMEPRGEEVMRFLAEELKPAIEARFRAGAPFVLMGHSHGGILCVYAAAKWRSQFPFILALDAPVNLDEFKLSNDLAQSATSGGNLNLVSEEVRFGWTDPTWEALRAKAPKSWTLTRIRLEGETHESMVFGGVYRGLRELFRQFSPAGSDAAHWDESFRRYQSVRALYGEACLPPQFVVERALQELIALGKEKEASEALAILRDSYGEPDEGGKIAAEIKAAAAALAGKETVEEMLSRNPPTASEIAPYLGVWKGTQWIDLDADRKQPLIVTIGVENGKAVASAEHPLAPSDEYRHEKYRYLRVTPAGLEFGNRNGMFPPAVIAHEASLEGDVLKGESVFKGVYFVRPADAPWPRHYFELKREP